MMTAIKNTTCTPNIGHICNIVGFCIISLFGKTVWSSLFGKIVWSSLQILIVLVHQGANDSIKVPQGIFSSQLFVYIT